MNHRIATVISYCTNDLRFIGKCIHEARKFSSQIVVPVCDHFFDGSPENRPLLDQTYADHPDCSFIEFAYLPNRLYSPYHRMAPDDPDWAIYWAGTTRYVGLHYLNPDCRYILFLDSDEILDGDGLLQWLDTRAYTDFSAIRLAAYLYALRPSLRAKKVVNLPLFVEKSTLAPLTLLNGLERIGAYLTHPGPKREKVVGLDGKPMVHHYSWVRTKEECLQKARTWGHRGDHDWPTLIEKTFNGTSKQLFDLSWHEFEEIKAPFFDPFEETVFQRRSSQPSFPNVIHINDIDLLKKTFEV